MDAACFWSALLHRHVLKMLSAVTPFSARLNSPVGVGRRRACSGAWYVFPTELSGWSTCHTSLTGAWPVMRRCASDWGIMLKSPTPTTRCPRSVAPRISFATSHDCAMPWHRYVSSALVSS